MGSTTFSRDGIADGHYVAAWVHQYGDGSIFWHGLVWDAAGTTVNAIVRHAQTFQEAERWAEAWYAERLEAIKGKAQTLVSQPMFTSPAQLPPITDVGGRSIPGGGGGTTGG